MFGTWEAFLDALKANYVGMDDVMTARQEWQGLKQTGKVGDYVQKFRTLTTKISDTNDAEKRQRFIAGLQDQTKLYILEKRPETTAAAMILAQQFETEIWPLRKQALTGTTPATSGTKNQGYGTKNQSWKGPTRATYSDVKRDEHGRNAYNRPLDNPQRTERYEKGLCFNCGGSGHISRDCRRPSKQKKV